MIVERPRAKLDERGRFFGLILARVDVIKTGCVQVQCPMIRTALAALSRDWTTLRCWHSVYASKTLQGE